MSISSLFSDLGAPLRNTRWSWGSVHPRSGAVFLRVWQDDIRRTAKGNIVRLTNRSHFEGTTSLGYAERKRHIELLREGRPGYLIFCESERPGSVPRKLKNFVTDRVFPTGALCNVDGDVYIEFSEGITPKQVPKR